MPNPARRASQRAAKALLQAGALQRAIFNSANFSSIATDAKGVIQIFNVGAERMLGYTAADVVNTITPADISDPAEVVARAQALSLELGTPITPGFEALVFKASRGIEDIYELTYIRKDGSRFPAVVSVTALRDAQDAIIGYLLIGTDNTARQQASQYARSLIEASLDPLVTISPEGKVTDVNEGSVKATGVPREKLVGTDFSNYFTEPEKAREGYRQVFAKGFVTDYPLTIRHENGRLTDVLYNASVYKDAHGHVLGVFAAARDITARMQAEAALLKAGALQRAIFNSANFSSIATDATGVIQIFNVGAERMLGYAAAEVMNTITPADISDPQELIARAQALSVELGTPITPGFEALVFKASRGIEDIYELTYIRKDGSRFPAVVSVTALRDAQDAIIGYLLIGTDNTARQRAADELQRLQSTALNAAADAIVIADRAGVIEWVNPAFTRLTGYSGTEALGKPLRNLTRPDSEAQALFEECWETILAGRTWRGQTINLRKDGSPYTEEQVVTPILDGAGAITHFIAIKEDITERLKLEAQYRQAQKMESVGQLASGIAHDFNNLLTVINGMAELVLAQISPDNRMHADVEEIGRSGERAAVLTRQLLAFSRRQILEMRVVSLHAVVTGIESLLRRLLGEDVNLVIVPPPGVGYVKADPGQIEQVITNLAVNARDAMPEGGRLTIETRNVTLDQNEASQHSMAIPPGAYVLLTVSDSGVGMDEITRASIFEPFFTTKAPGKGTGLGLSTVHGIVKQSGGFISVYSEIGKGTSFKIFLPQVTEAGKPDQPTPTVASASGTETILLAEDNAGLRKLATRLLEPAGYTVLGAATGEEALRLLEGHAGQVHLLLSDVVMPGMSGRHLAEQLAKTRPGTKVLYMSGYTSDTVVRHGVLDAQMPFLNKPFTAAALLRKVREVLDSQEGITVAAPRENALP